MLLKRIIIKLFLHRYFPLVQKDFCIMEKYVLNKSFDKKRISNFLAVLGGADTEILGHVDSERNSFTSIGAVMLGTEIGRAHV